MSNEQKQFLNDLVSRSEDLTLSWIHYWSRFSSFDTWQFWINVSMLIGPLIVLYFLLDRRKAFHIGFFGFNVHVWFTYLDTFGARLGYWSYPYQSIPLMSVNFGLDVSFMPVLFMLIYQYTLNHNKNYYLYALASSLILSFTLKPLFVALDFLQLHKGLGYFHLFIALVPVILLSKWITNLFVIFERRS